MTQFKALWLGTLLCFSGMTFASGNYITVELVGWDGNVYQIQMKEADYLKIQENSKDTDSVQMFRLRCSSCVKTQ